MGSEINWAELVHQAETWRDKLREAADAVEEAMGCCFDLLDLMDAALSPWGGTWREQMLNWEDADIEEPPYAEKEQ